MVVILVVFIRAYDTSFVVEHRQIGGYIHNTKHYHLYDTTKLKGIERERKHITRIMCIQRENDREREANVQLKKRNHELHGM